MKVFGSPHVLVSTTWNLFVYFVSPVQLWRRVIEQLGWLPGIQPASTHHRQVPDTRSHSTLKNNVCSYHRNLTQSQQSQQVSLGCAEFSTVLIALWSQQVYKKSMKTTQSGHISFDVLHCIDCNISFTQPWFQLWSLAFVVLGIACPELLAFIQLLI